MSRVFIIAEAGVNHNGDMALAKQMIKVAKEAGVDAVKFQSFKAENLVSVSAPKAEYQKQTTDNDESQFDMLKKLEIDESMHKELMTCCKEHDIMFLSTPFDVDSLDLLINLGLDIIKIPSGEITNLPYLRKIGALKKKIILSTGMSDMAEVKDALHVLMQAGATKEEITLLHCNTEYPTPYEDVNLKAMLSIENELGVSVGYSDHTPGIVVSIAAVALGASVIEKHFTLDKTMEGPDHKASLDSVELKEMVNGIRAIEKSLGDGIKKASASEIKNKVIARKSIVAAEAIRKGDILSEENITTKRPAGGITPMVWDSILGKGAIRDFKKDEYIVMDEGELK